MTQRVDTQGLTTGWSDNPQTGGSERWIRNFRLDTFPSGNSWYWTVAGNEGGTAANQDCAESYAEAALAGMVLGCLDELLKTATQSLSEVIFKNLPVPPVE